MSIDFLKFLSSDLMVMSGLLLCIAINILIFKISKGLIARITWGITIFLVSVGLLAFYNHYLCQAIPFFQDTYWSNIFWPRPTIFSCFYMLGCWMIILSLLLRWESTFYVKK